MSKHVTRELSWFAEILRENFGIVVMTDVISIEAVELGLDEVEDFYVPKEFIDKQVNSLLYEVMLTTDKCENDWVGVVAFYPNSPNWCLQAVTKNGKLMYRNLLHDN